MKTIAITHMDWALLRKQKLWLLMVNDGGKLA